MSDDVRLRWMKLDKDAAKLLIEMVPENYIQYLLFDGTLIICMKNPSYGYSEAKYYWYKVLAEI
jgi:hypothetical protein